MNNKQKASTKDASSLPPPIAEKVRFWQEQDRINQLLIPRVLELSKGLGGLCERVEKFEVGEKTATWNYIASLEQRLKDMEDSLRSTSSDKAPFRDASRARFLGWCALVAAVAALFCAIFALIR
jgi:hypothetical protein